MQKLFFFFFMAFLLTGCGFSSHQSESDAPQTPTFNTNKNKKTIVAMGDSLTEGLNIPQEKNYPSQLEIKLQQEGYEHYKVANAGIPGETTSSAANRLDWVLRLEPDLVLLATGGNDALRGIDPEITQTNIEKMIRFFQEQEIPILLIGIQAPNNQGSEYTKAFNQIYSTLAEKYETPFMPLFWEGLEQTPEYFQADGIHPTSKGYTVMVDNLWSYLQPLLESKT